MGDKILIGPFNKGLRNDVTAFNIDNSSFPTLSNAYQWRGRVKRKRGTEFLGRLTRYFDSLNTGAVFNLGNTTQSLVGGVGNLITGFTSSGIQTGASIVPGTVTINDETLTITYTDPTMDGTLTGGAGGTINYATGSFTLIGGTTDTIDANFDYYPDLPVLGLETAQLGPTVLAQTVAFDQTYSYNIDTTSPYAIYSVSFYDNPASATYPTVGGAAANTQKTLFTPANWNLQNYQQVWTCNYQGAMWATPGIPSPYVSTNIGMQFKPIVSDTVLSATSVSLNIIAHGLVVGDFIFVNEIATTTGINFQTGYVTAVTDANDVVVTFPNATIATNGTGGIAQYLTNTAIPTKDCIRFYTGNMTSAAIPQTFTYGTGWVNFCPPLSQFGYDVADEDSLQYYLVGARVILPFKDRLLFFGPVIQSSSPSASPIYLQDTVIYSQNGTPYYTSSFAYDTVTPTINVIQQGTFYEILVPPNQTSVPFSFWEDLPGAGGYVTAGYSVPITTVSPNQDALIVGFLDRQAKFAYTSSGVFPFAFYIINSEMGSDSTFSVISLDRGVITIGDRGIVITDQISSQRIDLEIPDEVFEISLANAGNRRISSGRDFVNEWVYFSYAYNGSLFPSQTLFYNYRDDSWAIFVESYTTYGAFRKRTGNTWGTIGSVVGTWGGWTVPWNAGVGTLLQPLVIAGNQQGFVMVRTDETTSEGASLYISGISDSTFLVTSPNHGLNTGDYITINGCLGTVGAQVNGMVFSVGVTTMNTFGLNPASLVAPFTYLGGGTITRYYVPLIKTKQFPTAWEMGRKTRLGVQQYLFTTTDLGQVTLLIFLSQNDDFAYNLPPIVPALNPTNNSLIYSTTVYTCPESTNLGLTPSNINLQIPTAINQQQTWHRMNTSLIGDTVQVGITLNDSQMRDPNRYLQIAEIELHSVTLDVSPSQLLV